MDAVMTTSVDATSTEPSPIEEVLTKIDEMAVLAAYLKKVVKPLLKKGVKSKRRTGERTRNGFQSPVMMAPAIVEFLNNNFADKDITTEDPIPRTDVTQLLTTYIKSKNLQVADNRKNFVVDSQLAKIFCVNEGYISNWFEMQKFLRPLLTSMKQEVPSTSSTTTSENTTEVSEKKPVPPSKRIKKN